MPPIIVFSHANGFPAGTYRRLFDTWRAAGYGVKAIEKYGHDPAYPVTSNWPRLLDQLLDLVQAQGRPVHLVGHSLGGFLSLLAACKRPSLALSVVMLESPIIAGWRAHGVQMAKLSGLMRRVSPGRVSFRRRTQWASAEAAYVHFAGKPVFARWHPEVLRDYVAAGTEPDPTVPGGVRLAFQRDVETAIYNTLPHHLPRWLRRHPPQAPVHYIGGTHSAEARRAGLAATRALVHERMHWVAGTHLFPMERPDEAAAAVLHCLRPAAA